MIPHAPPMRFEVDGDAVVLPEAHPLAEDGSYRAVALIELAAQLAGRALAASGGGGVAGAPQAGMLVEVDKCILHASEVAARSRVAVRVTHVRSFGVLHRFEVALEGVLTTELTVRVGSAPA